MHLAALVERSQRALRSEAAEAALDSANMLAPLKSVLRRAPVACGADTTLGEAIRRMHAERVGSIVVLDAQGLPGGIFTTVDLLESMARGVPLDTPVRHAHDAAPGVAGGGGHARRRRARHGAARLPPHRGDARRQARRRGLGARPVRAAAPGLAPHRRAHPRRARLEQLVEAARDIRQLTRHLLAQGVAAGPLTAMVSALNDALTRRVIELAAARRSLAGAWCWLALGSEGRLEQTLVTDQDNCLDRGGREARRSSRSPTR
jgi:CBS domain-containing protein